jgi:hypothetical protein
MNKGFSHSVLSGPGPRVRIGNNGKWYLSVKSPLSVDLFEAEPGANPDPTPIVRADRGKVRSRSLNILLNTIKYHSLN